MENLEKKEELVEEKKCCSMMCNKKIWIPCVVILVLLIIVGGLLIFNKSQEEVVVVDEGGEQQAVVTKEYPGKMYLESMYESVKVGDEVKVNILLDTMGTNIVATNIKFNYNPTKWELVRVDDENSVLTIEAIENTGEGYVEIVRGEPGDGNVNDSDDGYVGSDGLLSSVVLKALEVGEARVWLDEVETKVAVDDGQATLMKLELMDLNILVN